MPWRRVSPTPTLISTTQWPRVPECVTPANRSHPPGRGARRPWCGAASAERHRRRRSGRRSRDDGRPRRGHGRRPIAEQLGQPPMLRAEDLGRSERHEREPMCSTGERLGPRRPQERAHRPCEQEPGSPALAVDDALDVGAHLRGAMELVDRHQPRRGKRGTDVLTNELEHTVVVEVEHERVPSMGNRAQQRGLPGSAGPFEQDRRLFVEQSVDERIGPPLHVPDRRKHLLGLAQTDESSLIPA